jgi:hypothetical protein
MVGNHDLYNKGSNDINSVRLFGYINKNITVYEKTETLEIGGKKIVFMPWVEKRLDMIKELSNNLGDYLFCHSDLNGCKMHLNSVAHRNADKIDVDDFNKYKRVSQDISIFDKLIRTSHLLVVYGKWIEMTIMTKRYNCIRFK